MLLHNLDIRVFLLATAAVSISQLGMSWRFCGMVTLAQHYVWCPVNTVKIMLGSVLLLKLARHSIAVG